MPPAKSPSPAHVSGPARVSGASRWFDLLYILLALLLIPYFIFRRLKGKKSAPWSARMARLPQRSPERRRVWIHAVSVGEVNAAAPLVKALNTAFPDAEIVISTTTATGNAVALKKYGAGSVLQYPHDFSWVVRRFLDRVRPSVAILMELEVWPNMTAEARARGIPILVVNARITERSAKRYKLGWTLVGPSFRRVDAWLAQSQEYAQRLKALGVDPEKIELSGNIKYDDLDTALPDPSQRAALRAGLGMSADAPVLIGGSTHPGEESALLDAYRTLRATSIPALRLMLVPRHPERFEAVAREIDAAKFPCARFSAIKASQEKSRPDAVILIDAMGELKGMYAAADIAFIGGSLIPHGGQNIMEPCGMGLCVLHGPHMHNFNDAMSVLRECNGAVEVSGERLAAAIESVLLNPAESAAMAARARGEFLKRQGASKLAVERISSLLRARSQAGSTL